MTFHRLQLAQELCDQFERTVLADAIAGLFLAAPRRTGKTTFLREDLVPEMRRRGWETVYVDLWSDRTRDPAVLIHAAILEALRTYDSLFRRAVRKSGVEKVTGAGVSVDLSKVGATDGATLSQLLEQLAERSGRPVGLIIDEAQHALSTEAGLNAMFALKAARDHLNQGERRRLFLVFTGSHRDKLGYLVMNKAQPFFGATLRNFPLLGRDFVEDYAQTVNARLASDNRFSVDALFAAFKLVGHRPELLMQIVSEVALGLGEAPHLNELLHTRAQAWRQQVFGVMDADFESLTPIQRAVLQVMSEKGQDFSPFTEESLSAYRRLTGDERIGAATAQTALEALRDKQLVWKSARGVYALEDESWAEWIQDKTHSTAPGGA